MKEIMWMIGRQGVPNQNFDKFYFHKEAGENNSNDLDSHNSNDLDSKQERKVRKAVVKRLER